MFVHFNLYSMPWIEIHGIIYKKQAFVVADCPLLPHFVCIVDIVLTGKLDCFFVCEDYHTVEFSSHYHSYEVIRVQPREIFALKQEDLVDYHALTGQMLLSGESLFISPKYHIIEDTCMWLSLHWFIILWPKDMIVWRTIHQTGEYLYNKILYSWWK